MIYKIIFLIAVFITANLPGYSQGWYKNYEKYWYYRYRLVNDFMQVGPNCGQSLPGFSRTQRDSKPFDNIIRWGDATQALGQYLAMLSTEYKLLNENGWNTERTKYENYNALLAFERVDRNSEGFCRDYEHSDPCEPNVGPFDLNGFFVRDDVPQNFVITNENHFNRPGIGNGLHVEGTQSDFGIRRFNPIGGPRTQAEWYADPDSYRAPFYPVEESQDQVVEMFVGLGLTTKLMGGATYGSTNLGDRARMSAERIIEWPAYNGTLSWQIQNPLNFNWTYGTVPESYGQSALPFFLGPWRSGANMMYIARAAGDAVKYISPSHSYFSVANPYELGFQALQNIGQFDNQFAENLAVFGRSWRGLQNQNTTFKTVMVHSLFQYFRTPHIPLIYKLLHPGGKVGWSPDHHKALGSTKDFGGYKVPSYFKLLDSAPDCGPHYYPDLTSEEGEWTGPGRLTFSHQRAFLSPHSGDHNGVDYMFLFNLFSLVEENYIQWVINPYYEPSYHVDYPDQGGLGSHATPLRLNYLEYLGLTNKINSDGNVRFRGAKVVILEPGFDAKQGSFFEAYAHDYYCEEEGYHYAEKIIDRIPDNTGGNYIDIGEPIAYNPSGDEYIPRQERRSPEYEQDSVMGTIPNEEWLAMNEQALRQYEADTTAEGNLARLPAVPKCFLWPNPSKGSFKISLPDTEPYNLFVMGLEGRIIATFQVKDQLSFEIQHQELTPGLYFLKVENEHFIQTLPFTILK